VIFTVSRDIQSRSPGIGDMVLKRREGCSLSMIADTPFISRVARLRPPVRYSAVQSCAVWFSVVWCSAVSCSIVRYSVGMCRVESRSAGKGSG
jgi:hypothetical protein